MSKAVPEADATPDEAFELGQISGYDRGYADAFRDCQTAEHEAQHEVVTLLEWSAQFLDRGQHIKAAAMVEAARELLAARYGLRNVKDVEE